MNVQKDHYNKNQECMHSKRQFDYRICEEFEVEEVSIKNVGK